jgi:chromosome partitioning protein
LSIENRIKRERGYSGIGTFEGAIMHIWAAIMQKGGAGRTVLTVNLACQAAKQGLTTLVINLDKQPPLHAWFQARLASEIPNDRLQVISASMGELPFLLEEAARQGVNLVIIDTAPHVKREVIEISRLSETVLMPVRPAVWDIAGLRETLEILSLSKTGAYGTADTAALDKALVVLNCVNSCTGEAGQALNALDDLDIKYICKTCIGERIEVRKAAAIGQGVCEFAPDGKTAAEFAGLFNEIVQWHSTAAKKQAEPDFVIIRAEACSPQGTEAPKPEDRCSALSEPPADSSPDAREATKDIRTVAVEIGNLIRGLGVGAWNDLFQKHNGRPIA